MNYLWIAMGGAIGSVLRYAAGRGMTLWLGAAFPYGTLLVNIAGSFAIGLLASWFAAKGSADDSALRLLLITGVLGGFTTFSAFSLDTVLLWERGQAPLAALYVLLSVGVSLAALGVGLWLGRSLLFASY